MNRKILFLLLVLSGAIAFVWKYPPPSPNDPVPVPVVKDEEVKTAGNFYDCVDEGNPIRESWPPSCTTKSGKTIVQDIGNELEQSDQIKIKTPRPATKVISPQKIEGEARGGWFFEGQLTAKMLNEEGEIIGEGILTSTGEWMTEDFVPFTGSITFDPGKEERGKLIIEKANPSDLPENADQLIVVVVFK